jgi:hypothetical protein
VSSWVLLGLSGAALNLKFERGDHIWVQPTPDMVCSVDGRMLSQVQGCTWCIALLQAFEDAHGVALCQLQFFNVLRRFMTCTLYALYCRISVARREASGVSRSKWTMSERVLLHLLLMPAVVLLR